MNIILDNTKEVFNFLIKKGLKNINHLNGKIIADKIVVNGNEFREISRSGFPFTINAIDYRGRFKDAMTLFS